MSPTPGRIVHYRLTAEQSAQINRRRTTGTSIANRLTEAPPQWPAGAQAHIGNTASEGEYYPMIVVRMWDDNPGVVNGQVFLDGNDQLWVTSAKEGTEPGTWAWPPRS